MLKSSYVGLVAGIAAIAGLMTPMHAATAWNGIEGCSPGYWKNNTDTNDRAQELIGINVHAAVLDITGLNLDNYNAFNDYEDITTDQAVQLKGGGLNAFYRHLGAAIFNTYYGVKDIDYIEPTTTFTNIIQQAIDGDTERAKDALDVANNLGCPIDAFGDPEEEKDEVPTDMTVEFSAHWLNQDGPGTPVCEDVISGTCGPYIGSATRSDGVVTGTWFQVMPRGALCFNAGIFQELTTDGNTFEMTGTYEGTCTADIEIGSPVVVEGECGTDSEISFTIGGTENRFIGDSTCSVL